MSSFRDRFEKRIPRAVRRAQERQGVIQFQDEQLAQQIASVAKVLGMTVGEYIEVQMTFAEQITDALAAIKPVTDLKARLIVAAKLGIDAANKDAPKTPEAPPEEGVPTEEHLANLRRMAESVATPPQEKAEGGFTDDPA